jgi:uncharacterized repeat protein (TIGR01451 family)
MAGDTISYTLTAANAGPDFAENVTLFDDLPASTTFVSLVQNNGPSAACVTPPAGFRGLVSCSFSALAAGASAQFTLSILIGNTMSVGNTATITTESFDPNGSNDLSTVTTTVTPRADVAVVKTGPGSVTAGTNTTYTVDLTNNGPSDAMNVLLTDTLPANTTFVSILQTSGPAFSCTTPAIGAAGTISCSIATLPPGTLAGFSIVLMVSSGTPAGNNVSNTASVGSTTGDPSGGNNTSTTTGLVASSADSAVVKSGPAVGVAGSDLTYTVTATNNGPSDATSVTLTDPLPASTTFVSATQTSGPAFSCTTPAVGGTGTITCTIPALTPAASATFTFVVNAATVGSMSNTANISSVTPDANATNNTSTVSTTVSAAPVADVLIVKTANAPVNFAGQPAVFTLVVSNSGPSAAAAVTVSDVLPPGTALTSATPSQGSCTGTTTVLCTLGSVAASASATIVISVNEHASELGGNHYKHRNGDLADARSRQRQQLQYGHDRRPLPFGHPDTFAPPARASGSEPRRSGTDHPPLRGVKAVDCR